MELKDRLKVSSCKGEAPASQRSPIPNPTTAGASPHIPQRPPIPTTATSPHHRRSIRLAGYNYTQPGAYFVTIVTHNRESLLGQIIDGQMQLNPLGAIAAAYWRQIPRNFPNATLDAWIVMPNHIHGIIIIARKGEASAVQQTGLSKRSEAGDLPLHPSPPSPPSRPSPPPNPPQSPGGAALTLAQTALWVYTGRHKIGEWLVFCRSMDYQIERLGR